MLHDRRLPPAEFPVVLQAAIATLEPDFNLLGIQTTTGTPTAAVLVHGPAISTLGMNPGTNCLGPGNRANACIGRALRLVLTNIGGARPLIGDMATMGQPAKYGMAFAEAAHPLAMPMHARRGLDPRESAVTVIGLSGTLEVLPEAAAATPEAVLRPALSAMRGAREAGSGGRHRDPGEQFLLLPPEMADVIAKAGWTLAQAQEYLQREFRHGLAHRPHARRHPHHHHRWGRGKDDLPCSLGRRHEVYYPAAPSERAPASMTGARVIDQTITQDA